MSEYDEHALADTQRVIIEAAERRGYERAREELDRVMAELLAENERLAEANDLLKRDEALLRQALEALVGLDWYAGQLEMLVYSPDDIDIHKARAEAQNAIAAIDQQIAALRG